MQYQELISRLGETVGVGLSLSPAGTAAVMFDGDEVNFETVEGRLYIYADIASAEGRESDYATLLAANSLCLGTDGAAAGLDRERGTFTLCRVLDGGMEYPVFEQAVAGFIDALRSLKRTLSGASAPAPDGAEAPAPEDARTGDFHDDSFMKV